MKWKDVWAKDLVGFMKVLNNELRHFLSNLDENNLKLNQIKLGESTIFIDEADGALKIKKPDGTIKTFSLIN